MHLLVLSAFRQRKPGHLRSRKSCLNAPFGAQCFPTQVSFFSSSTLFAVSMHLLVLSAFRHGDADGYIVRDFHVSMHLLVLSAFRPKQIRHKGVLVKSQCTFWCSVLSDRSRRLLRLAVEGLNAPFGAQCFPTRRGARQRPVGFNVSMHLLVLSAFRHRAVLP